MLAGGGISTYEKCQKMYPIYKSIQHAIVQILRFLKVQNVTDLVFQNCKFFSQNFGAPVETIYKLGTFIVSDFEQFFTKKDNGRMTIL